MSKKEFYGKTCEPPHYTAIHTFIGFPLTVGVAWQITSHHFQYFCKSCPIWERGEGITGNFPTTINTFATLPDSGGADERRNLAAVIYTQRQSFL